MLTRPLLAIVALLPLSEAHTRFTTLHINGQSQGDGVCIRQDQNPGTTTNFVPSITGSEMACGVDGDMANPTTCPVVAGDQISLEHRMWPDASQPGAIDVSHKGNTAIYMKKVNSDNHEVTGNGWFKIYWDGYDSTTGEWGTDHMNANNGLVTTTVPADLTAGNYLIRSEVLALQEVGDPQFYVGCAQVQLSGTGSAIPSNTANIPGYIDMSTPAMNVNIYESFTFGEFGPQVYGSAGSNANSTSISTGVAGTPTATSTSTASKTSSTANVLGDKDSATSQSDAGTDTAFVASQAGSSTLSTSDTNDSAASVDAINSHDEDYSSTASTASSAWRNWARWNNAKSRSRPRISAVSAM